MLMFSFGRGSTMQHVDFASTTTEAIQSTRPIVRPHIHRQMSSMQTTNSTNSGIRDYINRQIKLRERAFRNDLPFSWIRFCIGFVSLSLCLTDVVRSGLGVNNLNRFYTMLEPDVATFYDPWNFTIAKLAKNESDTFNMHNQSIRVWSYKFDSTSIAWRALVRHFDLAGTTFPGCLLYTEPCPTLKLKGDVVFLMIDSLVDAVAATSTQTIQLRTVSMYVDRVHDFVLPPSFRLRHWRTNQALYYSAEELSRLGARLCHTGNGKQPNFCQERWVNYRRSCSRKNKICQQVGRILDHTIHRVSTTKRKFPNAIVDLLFIESQEDAARVEGGLSMVGVRRSDISTVIRARNCHTGELHTCETIYVEDYRYEADIIESNVSQLYLYAASLRILGQLYFMLRVFCLLLGCYYATYTPSSIYCNKVFALPSSDCSKPINNGPAHNQHLFNFNQLELGLATFCRVPTQCVVYGSWFPVFCYALAHFIDAPIMYVILEKRFTTRNGVLHLNYKKFITLAVVQMRNVWLFSIFLHLYVAVMASRRWRGWSHISGGIPGVPEFLLAGFSSATIAAQFRSTTFRNTQILSVYPVESTGRNFLQMIQHQRFGERRGENPYVLGGILIDLKCFAFLATFMVIVVGIGFIARSVVSKAARGYRCPKCSPLLALICPHNHRKQNDWNLRWLIVGSTPVPYSAGLLWPTTAMCVHWTRDFFCIAPPLHGPSASKIISNSIRHLIKVTHLGLLSRTVDKLSTALSVAVRMDYSTFSSIQLQIERVHDRQAVVEANIAFMNLVIMSDPLVYVSRFISLRDEGMLLGFYKSKRYLATNNDARLMLLPCDAVVDDNEEMQDLELLEVVETKSLPWAELIQCG